MPFSETIFLWQSIVIAVVLIVISVVIASRRRLGRRIAPSPRRISAWTSRRQGALPPPPARRVAGILAAADHPAGRLAGGLARSRVRAAILRSIAISNLNTYNLLFLTLGMLLHWRPKRFLIAVAKAVPATAGVLIQFPLYGVDRRDPHTG